ncbi:heme oxygenase-domain-containing protein [Gilbertella persicaria]|uniref:heme oxygenase-domain-containing protein n=1 Tax=Gilbertella persicaria TaxID=101096 RepID=UPI0022200534|nr:heme oxygenase-domain-containing protein [Gilbertella persicaria]KAI8076523.1 heme oxygenase-domain-containing protein [Gilbertella persicaria]
MATKKSDACPFMFAGQEVSISQQQSQKNEKGCPFTSNSDDDIKDMMSQNLGENSLGSEVKLSSLNYFLPETQIKRNHEYLLDPQLASAMKEGTKIVHSAAENSAFTKRFLSGNINKDEYGRYINSLYFVYKTMEELLAQHKDNPSIKMVYFPCELNREQALIKDLEYYYGKERVADLIDFKHTTPAVKNYIASLKHAAERDPALLIAHSYSRYLGDLSGGQILAKRLKKYVLKIDVTDAAWDSYEGLKFYNFDHIGSQLEFKNLYRQRLDCAHVTQYLKDLIVTEAIRSFELNISLFNEIQELSEAHQLNPTLSDTESVEENHEYKLPGINTDWLVGFFTGTLTLVVGLSLYHRFSYK